MKPRRAWKQFCNNNDGKQNIIISWKAIAEHMLTRSIDDIRNYWMLKIVPIIVKSSGKSRKMMGSTTGASDVLDHDWTEAEDINLLEGIEA